MMGRWEDQAPRNIAEPEAGFFLMRLVRGGPYVPARIIVLAGMWQAEIGGEIQSEAHPDPFLAAGVSRIWESGRRVTEDEYRFHMRLSTWARQSGRGHPAADPTQPIDLTKIPPIF